MDNRAALQVLNTELIRTNGGPNKTRAVELRSLVSALIVSLTNILDDKNAINGYAGLDSSGKILSVALSSVSPAGNFLSDSGIYKPLSAIDTNDKPTYLMLSTFSDFVFNGDSSTWTSMPVQGNKKYTITNIGNNIITLNYSDGTNKLYDNNLGVAVNSFSIGDHSFVRIIDNGTYLIIIE